MGRTATGIDRGNRFKLGLFGLNCSGGITSTSAPERWDASWANNLEAARLADGAGLDFLLPIARWQGYGGATDRQAASFETLTWATGLLTATRDISVFSTVHVSLLNPVFAAKQAVTADHAGAGRFGLNIVSGWNVGEFEMFGADLLDHDDRYAYSEEWLTIVKRIWSEPEPFDFTGRFFALKGVRGRPGPYGGGQPLLMSAGSSPAGRTFAARHADCLFMVIVDPDKVAADVEAVRAAATRPVGVYASGHLISRRTDQETRDYYHYLTHEHGDWEGADHAMAKRLAGGGQSIPAARILELKERFISGGGTHAVIGSYDVAAQEFKRLSDAGLDGMAIGLVNYIDDLPALRDEILPRMARLGLRGAAAGLRSAG